MHEFPQHSSAQKRIHRLHGDSAGTHTIFSRRDRVGLTMIRALCKTPPEIDIHAFVRGDIRTFGVSIGALVFDRAKNKVFKAHTHL